MAMAEERPAPSPNRDIIQRFREEYGHVLEDARVSEKHTATEGWQRLYAAQAETIRARRREIAKRVKSLADTLEDFGWSEDDEKAVKDAVKTSADIRDSDAAFQRQTVEPVKSPVMECSRIAERYLNEARRDEESFPLPNVGLTENMKMEIAKQPRPAWDAEAGVVEFPSAPL